MPGSQTQPITDEIREALAPALTSFMPEGHFEGARILDVFAGSGVLGMELLSSGAGECLFLEQDITAYETLKDNLVSFALSTTQARACCVDSLSPALLSCLKGEGPFDIIMVNPRCDLALSKLKSLLSTLGRAGFLLPQGIVCYIHAADDDHSLEGFVLCRACTPAALHLKRGEEYGSTRTDYYLCT